MEVSEFVNAGHFQVVIDTTMENPETWKYANAVDMRFVSVTVSEIRLGRCESIS